MEESKLSDWQRNTSKSNTLFETQNYTNVKTHPAPIDYDVSGLCRYGKIKNPAFSILGPRKEPVKPKCPGPGDYDNKSVRIGPAYSFGTSQPRETFNIKSSTPPPNLYYLPTTLGSKVPHMKQGNAFTLGGRNKEKKVIVTPGPSDYNTPNLDQYRNKQPAAKILCRNESNCGGDSPAPNAYNAEKCQIHRYKGKKGPTPKLAGRFSSKVLNILTPQDVE